MISIKRYFYLFILILFIFICNIVDASALSPYLILEVEHGNIIGNNIISMKAEGIEYMEVSFPSLSDKLSLVADIPKDLTYQVWIKAKGNATAALSIVDSGQEKIFNQSFSVNNSQWKWVKIPLDIELIEARYYVMVSEFVGNLSIDKIILNVDSDTLLYNIQSSSESTDVPILPNESPWEKQGLNPFASLLSNGNEHVSVTSGILTVSMTDLVIPGRNGLDLVLKRSHSSKAHSEEKRKKGYLPFNWNFGFPLVGKYEVRFPNGSVCNLNDNEVVKDVEKINNSDDRKVIYENSINRYFKLIRYENYKGDDLFGNPTYSIRDYDLYFANGTLYHFNSFGKVEFIEDKNGNRIQVTYNSDEYIDKLTDSIGRLYDIIIESSTIKIVRKTDDRVMVTYNIANSKLMSVEDVLKRKTSYQYGAGIKEIIYPGGKIGRYGYNSTEYSSYSIYTVASQEVKINNNNNEELVRKNEFEYDFTIPKKRKINYVKVRKYNEDSLLISSSINYTNDHGMLTKSKIINENSGKTVLTNYYEYNISKQTIKSSTYKGTDKEEQYLISKEIWDFDKYGNQTYHQDPEGYKTMTSYCNTVNEKEFHDEGIGNGGIDAFYNNTLLNERNKNIHNLPSGRLKIRKYIDENGQRFESQEEYYQYDEDGNLKESKILSMDEYNNHNWIVTEYSNYDQYGNCGKIIFDVNSTEPIEINYEYNAEYNAAYLTKLTKYISRNLVDNNANIIAGKEASTFFEYDYDTGDKKKVTNSQGSSVTYLYDDIGRPIKVIYPKTEKESEASFEEVFYDDDNNLVKVYDCERKNLTIHYFDGLGREISVEKYNDLEGIDIHSSVRKTYNWLDKIKDIRDQNGKLSSLEYDLFGRNIEYKTDDGKVTNNDYELVANPRGEGLVWKITTTNPEGIPSIVVKDQKGQTIESTQTEDKDKDKYISQEYFYDGYGKLVNLIDGKGNKIGYEYNNLGQNTAIKYSDHLGEVSSLNHPAYLTVFNKYNSKGQLKEVKNRNNQSISYSYNEYGQLIKVDLAESDNIEYYYNELGQLIKVAQGNDYQKIYAYDKRGRQIDNKISLDKGNYHIKEYQLAYEYNKNNQLLNTKYPDNKNLVYEYNNLNQISSSAWDGNGIINNVLYNKTGHIKQMNYGNSKINTYNYTYNNNQYLPTSISYGETVRFDYRYDPLGNIIKINDQLYKYDDIGQLTGWQYLKDNEQVLLAEEIIWQKDMEDNNDLSLNSTMIHDNELLLATNLNQDLLDVVKLMDDGEVIGQDNVKKVIDKGYTISREPFVYTENFDNLEILDFTDVSVEEGQVRILENQEDERWETIPGSITDFALERDSLEKVNIDLGSISPNTRYSGYDYWGHVPEPTSTKWHSFATLNLNNFADISKIKLKLKVKLYNEWKLFSSGWGNWTIYIKMEMNQKYLGMREFKTDTESVQTQTKYITIDLKDKDLINTGNPQIKLYYCINKWGHGVTKGGYIEQVQATGLERQIYSVEQEVTRKINLTLHEDQRYKLDANEVKSNIMVNNKKGFSTLNSLSSADGIKPEFTFKEYSPNLMPDEYKFGSSGLRYSDAELYWDDNCPVGSGYIVGFQSASFISIKDLGYISLNSSDGLDVGNKYILSWWFKGNFEPFYYDRIYFTDGSYISSSKKWNFKPAANFSRWQYYEVEMEIPDCGGKDIVRWEVPRFKFILLYPAAFFSPFTLKQGTPPNSSSIMTGKGKFGDAVMVDSPSSNIISEEGSSAFYNTATWLNSDVEIIKDNTCPVGNEYVAKLDARNNVDVEDFGWVILDTGERLSVGKKYTLSWWFKGNEEPRYIDKLNFTDGSYIQTEKNWKSKPAPDPEKWQYYEVEMEITDDGGKEIKEWLIPRFYYQAIDNTSIGYFSPFMLEENTYATTFVDGKRDDELLYKLDHDLTSDWTILCNWMPRSDFLSTDQIYKLAPFSLGRHGEDDSAYLTVRWEDSSENSQNVWDKSLSIFTSLSKIDNYSSPIYFKDSDLDKYCLIALRYNSSEEKIYFDIYHNDGTISTTSLEQSLLAYDENELRIGQGDNGEYSNSLIDEFLITEGILSDEEIQLISNENKPLNDARGHVWHFDSNVIEYKLSNQLTNIMKLSAGQVFEVDSSGNYNIDASIKTFQKDVTPEISSLRVFKEKVYKDNAIVKTKPINLPGITDRFELKVDDLKPVGTDIKYFVNLHNDDGTYTTKQAFYDSDNDNFVTEIFPYKGSKVEIWAELITTNNKYTPTLINIELHAFNIGDYISEGNIDTREITITEEMPKSIIIELYGKQNTGELDAISIDLLVDDYTITGVEASVEDVITPIESPAGDNDIEESSIDPMGETDLYYELIEQAGLLRDEINNKELETLYYKFDLPEDLDYPKTVNLNIKIKSSADFSSSPNVYGFLLFDNYLRYLNTGSFATANKISSGNDYTFDTVRLDVDQNIPTETNIEYYADYNDNTRRVLSSGVEIPLLSEIAQIKINGELTTNNNTVSPMISNISLTAIGETPLSNELDSVSDIETNISATLSLSEDRVVGSHSIMIDHSSQGYGEYTFRSEQNFNTDKLPVVKLWVKPLTDNDISFKIHDVTTGIDETITSDSDHNGYFEIGEDLRKDEWNLLLLDLKETAGGGVEKDAGTLKVVINSYGTKVLLDGVDSLPLNEASYEYDKAGNRKYHIVNGLLTTYEYKPGTNLLERRYNSREEVWYQYDYEGNLISQRITDNLIGDIIIFDYIYNELNQLKEVRKNSQLIAEYSYDNEGLRYRKVDYLSGKTTIYIYGQGTEPIYEEIYDNEDLANPIEENSYLFMGNKRIAKDSNGTVSYYYTDHLGSTRAVDTSGEVIRLDYAPFGEDFRPTSERYKFTGKEDDVSTGLYYYNARYYDPAIGRFITEDLAKDGGNWYLYCRNSPLRYVDPDGRDAIIVNDSSRAFGFGHLFAIAIDPKTKNGLVYSFAPDNGKGVKDGLIKEGKISYDIVSKQTLKNKNETLKWLLDNEFIDKIGESNSNYYDDVSFAMVELNDKKTLNMIEYFNDLHESPPYYNLSGNNCDDIVIESLIKAGENYSRKGVNIPDLDMIGLMQLYKENKLPWQDTK